MAGPRPSQVPPSRHLVARAGRRVKGQKVRTRTTRADLHAETERVRASWRWERSCPRWSRRGQGQDAWSVRPGPIGALRPPRTPAPWMAARQGGRSPVAQLDLRPLLMRAPRRLLRQPARRPADLTRPPARDREADRRARPRAGALHWRRDSMDSPCRRPRRGQERDAPRVNSHRIGGSCSHRPCASWLVATRATEDGLAWPAGPRIRVGAPRRRLRSVVPEVRRPPGRSHGSSHARAPRALWRRALTAARRHG